MSAWVVVLFAVLPLQWVMVPLPLVGAEPLHVVGLLALSGVVLSGASGDAASVPRRGAAFLTAAFGGLLAVSGAASYFHAEPLRPVLNQLLLLMVFVAMASAWRQGWADPDGALVSTARWAALVCSVSLVVGLGYSMAANGVDPVTVMARTISSADPHVLEREMFRNGIAGFGTDAADLQSNIRHEIFGAVLVALATSAAAVRLHPLGSRAAMAAYRASTWLSVALITVSLSRSVMLALGAWALVSFVRAARRGTLSNGHLAAVTGCVAGAVVVWSSGFAGVLVARFATDTDSYASRDSLLHRATDDIAAHVWTGGVDTVGRSAHNLVLDSWLRSGVAGGVLAACVVACIVLLWLELVLGLHREPSWLVPVAAMMAFPVVRLFTAGGGWIPPVAWLALGIAAGALAARHDARRRVRRQAPGISPVDLRSFRVHRVQR
jgi:hypothetical protein